MLKGATDAAAAVVIAVAAPAGMQRDDAAAYLGVSVRTLERLTEAHEIPVCVVRAGTRRLLVWRREDIDQYLAQLVGPLPRSPLVVDPAPRPAASRSRRKRVSPMSAIPVNLPE